MSKDTPLDRLKHHVSGAIERGEAKAIEAVVGTQTYKSYRLHVEASGNVCIYAHEFIDKVNNLEEAYRIVDRMDAAAELLELADKVSMGVMFSQPLSKFAEDVARLHDLCMKLKGVV